MRASSSLRPCSCPSSSPRSSRSSPRQSCCGCATAGCRHCSPCWPACSSTSRRGQRWASLSPARSRNVHRTRSGVLGHARKPDGRNGALARAARRSTRVRVRLLGADLDAQHGNDHGAVRGVTRFADGAGFADRCLHAVRGDGPPRKARENRHAHSDPRALRGGPRGEHLSRRKDRAQLVHRRRGFRLVLVAGRRRPTALGAARLPAELHSYRSDRSSRPFPRSRWPGSSSARVQRSSWPPGLGASISRLARWNRA